MHNWDLEAAVGSAGDMLEIWLLSKCELQGLLKWIIFK
jgi:hypothetical protein